MTDNKYLTIDNSALYHELRSSVVSSDTWTAEDSSAKTLLTTRNNSIKATARIGPAPNSRLSDADLHEWRERVANYITTRMDDLNADILDATFALWLDRRSGLDGMASIQAADYFEYRGLRPNGHSYWTEQKKEIAARITLLSNTWINLFDASGYVFARTERSKLERIDTRVIVVSSAGEGRGYDGTQEYSWRIRPGDLFVPMLLTRSGKQLAMMSRKVLEYNYNLFPYEKRAARYITWLHRIRQGRGEYLSGIRVESLLSAIRQPIDIYNPIRTKKRLESALDRLAKDGVIRSWRYDGADESLLKRRGWMKEWFQWSFLIEPMEEVLERYMKIRPQQRAPAAWLQEASQKASGELAASLKKQRMARGLTQLQAATELGIAANYYAMLERGVREASSQLRHLIDAWLKL